ncbi:HNH endonuclease signature motif containing protein [Aspergillus alliaceus]|uniref:HNH endonuclease signature motif containing protein n=1 Tax=Petromyces alliaceus TaxID=209559 RepID=UPI0012A5525B|nr:uncharacterized protein BDW43DRAFT_295930 [Aspergillus alliaceus]KAB8239522.1 hypothetical protein BDW43DRAFT_295930 [Aspergillus alliaceus]
MSTLRSASTGPADELLDSERHKIIAQLSDYIGDRKLASTGWALLWFTDLAILRKYLKSVGLEPHGLLKRAQKNRVSKKPQRSASFLTYLSKCKERDHHACILTGYREPLEVAHIFPYSLSQREKAELDIFWENLGMYWSTEKINKWKEQVLGSGGTEICPNLMCMSNLAHKLWETARFALKPLSISEDQRVLKVKFYWMSINKFSDNMSSKKAPSPFPDGRLSSIKVEGKHNAKLFNINTEKALRSGDVLTFKTDDPVGHPLPSMELLNMQWALHRVLALSGAADATVEDLDPDPDKLLWGRDPWEMNLEATDEDVEEEMVDETEKEEELPSVPDEESWDEVVVEAPRFRGRTNPSTDENSPSRENRLGSSLPRSTYVHHMDEGEKLRQGEQAEQEEQESSLVFRFRGTNIH